MSRDAGASSRWTALRRRAADRLTVAVFRAAWRMVCRVPEPLAYRGFDLVADVSVRRGGAGVARMRANYARVRPEADDGTPDDAATNGAKG